MSFDPNNPLRLKRDEEHEDKDDEELLLEQDIGYKKRRRRKGIDTTQYNDDSSDEEYEAKKTKNDEDDDSDMFASDDEDDKSKEKVPRIEFMDLDKFEEENEIENKDLEQSEESDVDESYYNNPEERGIPKNEPKLDAFNLKNEKLEGRFDIDGNFIAIDNADDEKNNEDEWLLNFKKKDIKLAKIAQDRRDKIEFEKAHLKDTFTTEYLLFGLINLLKPVESPLEALQRLNKNKPKKYKKKLKDLDKSNQDEIIKMTEYCELLIEKGYKNIYELEKEELILNYREETGKNYVKPKMEETNEQGENASKEEIEGDKYQFRWVNDESIHGPYNLSEILYWKDNYFNNNAEVRKIGDEDFIHIDKFSNYSIK